MLTTIIDWTTTHRAWTLLAAMVLAVAGIVSFRLQSIDAYPDISPQVVMVITTYPGRATEEVERQVTVPIELAMGNVPRVESVRSRTIFGLSVVELMFEEGVEAYFARQRVQERLPDIELPTGVQPELGPLATAYGEIYRYELASSRSHDLMELRTLNDWVVIPGLLRTPGVAEVINFGGHAKQFTVTLEPAQLERFGLTLQDVVEAVQANNANAGGSVLRRGSMSFVIRGRGSFATIVDIESTVVNTVDGTPIYLRDVATVESRLDGARRHLQQGQGRRRGRRHRADAPRREPVAGAASGSRAPSRSSTRPAARGRADRAVLRPHVPGRQHAAHRRPQRV